MSRGVLFIGGRGPDPRFITLILKDGDLICAADSGLDAVLAAGLKPDGIVGDMDSVSDISLLEHYPADTVERYPADKDDSDTELGLDWLRRRGCRDIVLIGGGEGRLDHSLAILGLFTRSGAPGRWGGRPRNNSGRLVHCAVANSVAPLRSAGCRARVPLLPVLLE